MRLSSGSSSYHPHFPSTTYMTAKKTGVSLEERYDEDSSPWSQEGQPIIGQYSDDPQSLRQHRSEDTQGQFQSQSQSIMSLSQPPPSQSQRFHPAMQQHYSHPSQQQLVHQHILPQSLPSPFQVSAQYPSQISHLNAQQIQQMQSQQHIPVQYQNVQLAQHSPQTLQLTQLSPAQLQQLHLHQQQQLQQHQQLQHLLQHPQKQLQQQQELQQQIQHTKLLQQNLQHDPQKQPLLEYQKQLQQQQRHQFQLQQYHMQQQHMQQHQIQQHQLQMQHQQPMQQYATQLQQQQQQQQQPHPSQPTPPNLPSQPQRMIQAHQQQPSPHQQPQRRQPPELEQPTKQKHKSPKQSSGQKRHSQKLGKTPKSPGSEEKKVRIPPIKRSPSPQDQTSPELFKAINDLCQVVSTLDLNLRDGIRKTLGRLAEDSKKNVPDSLSQGVAKPILSSREEAQMSLLERALSYDLLRLMMVLNPPSQCAAPEDSSPTSPADIKHHSMDQDSPEGSEPGTPYDSSEKQLSTITLSGRNSYLSPYTSSFPGPEVYGTPKAQFNPLAHTTSVLPQPPTENMYGDISKRQRRYSSSFTELQDYTQPQTPRSLSSAPYSALEFPPIHSSHALPNTLPSISSRPSLYPPDNNSSNNTSFAHSADINNGLGFGLDGSDIPPSTLSHTTTTTSSHDPTSPSPSPSPPSSSSSFNSVYNIPTTNYMQFMPYGGYGGANGGNGAFKRAEDALSS